MPLQPSITLSGAQVFNRTSDTTKDGVIYVPSGQSRAASNRVIFKYDFASPKSVNGTDRRLMSRQKVVTHESSPIPTLITVNLAIATSRGIPDADLQTAVVECLRDIGVVLFGNATVDLDTAALTTDGTSFLLGHE